MKFTDGVWVTKPDHKFLSPVQAFDAKFDGKTLTIYSFTKHVTHRSNTLDQGNFVVRFSSCQPWDRKRPKSA